ncbi:hypothetical protein CDAR_239801 [Caerostris darwini]|uniref:Uncharacterized protein n=1 Tax=Caerostris darwini TaxID=1538125 RepID=A0AAV4R251_9ARAC|nr:hypothetical protein CDAR_239801 [Caerostris darwini]
MCAFQNLFKNLPFNTEDSENLNSFTQHTETIFNYESNRVTTNLIQWERQNDSTDPFPPPPLTELDAFVRPFTNAFINTEYYRTELEERHHSCIGTYQRIGDQYIAFAKTTEALFGPESHFNNGWRAPSAQIALPGC